jgi:hypothetical protein
MPPLIGHTTQRNALAELLRQERLPSTLLFIGKVGIGKQGVARELARHLLCQASQHSDLGGCGSCQPCRLFDAGNHPDLHTLDFGADGVAVDDVRTLLERITLRAFMKGRRVAILNDVDEISLIGANIILKSLEEPRPETFFLLTASTPSRLPVTLLSRCQRWFFEQLKPEEIVEILRQRGEGDGCEALAIAADGSVAAIAEMHAHAEMFEQTRAVVQAAYRDDGRGVTKAALAWGGDKEGYRNRITFLRNILRSKLLESGTDLNAAAVWAHALQCALDVEYLILDRHVNANLCFHALLRACSHTNASTYRNLPYSAPTLLERVAG